MPLDAGGLGARGRTEHCHVRSHARLDRPDLDLELPGDRLVGLTGHDEGWHLDLARCQGRV